MNTQKKVKGFTIIEVVLVLAIAGLIFLMVFIALPSLQRSQRDTQRKSDVSRIMTQISSYSANNRGKVPDSLIAPGTGSGATGTNSFVQNYLEGVSASEAGLGYSDPKTGTGYIFSATEAVTEATQIGYSKGLCGDDGTLITGSGRQYAIFIFLESQKAPYCVDNR